MANEQQEKVRVGIVGCGYWGPNLIRNFFSIPECEMSICCDLDEQKLLRMKSLYPGIKITTDFQEFLDSGIDAVGIVTPVSSHFPLAEACLNANKHVLIEKPVTSSSEEAIALIKLARENNKMIMAGHTFEYTTSVNKIKEIVDSGELGEILYINSTRVNLGLLQPDINVIWDLAPHDLSIILYVLGKEPTSVNAQGLAHYRDHIEDVAFTTLRFETDTIAFIHNSWLDPNKIRKMVFVGSKKMLIYDDISQNEKIKIYDKGVEIPPHYNTFAEFHFSYRYGDIYIPKVDESEPLKKECSHFIECIIHNKRPQSDGYSGLRVIKILEAANESLKNQGSTVPLHLTTDEGENGL